MAEELRGCRTRALDHGPVPPAIRSAYPPAHRRGEALPVHRADGARLRGQARARQLPAMVRKIRASLSAILSDAQERGLVGQNVVRTLRARRPRGVEAHADRRQKSKLKIGVDIPTPDEIRAIIAHLSGRWRPIILTAIFTGLRASELRGLRWEDIDLNAELHVRQRADRFNAIGRPKSEAGERIVPLPPPVVAMLREHAWPAPRDHSTWCLPTAPDASRAT